MRTKIIYEDKFIIVAYKPAGLATQTAKVGQSDMVSELKNYMVSCQARNIAVIGTSAGDDMALKGTAARKNKTALKRTSVYLGVIHRLDQPVEGLLIFAKDERTAAALTAQLGRGTLNKQYYAVICGQPSAKEGELVDYLCKDGTSGNSARAQVVTEKMGRSWQEGKHASGGDCSEKISDAKRAVLQYKIVKTIFVQVSGSSFSQISEIESTKSQISLADIHIDTGRFHQIRAQMAHAGMPLLGDSKYGTEESMALGRQLGVRNVALCAYRLDFTHPVTKKKMTFKVQPEGKIFTLDCE